MSRTATVPWTVGAWFGSQLGGTCWMAILALVVAQKDATTALTAVGVFLACNAVGGWLWSRRETMTADRAVQVLLGVLTVGTLGLAVVSNTRGAYVIPYWVILVYPVMMVAFAVRSARAAAEVR